MTTPTCWNIPEPRPDEGQVIVDVAGATYMYGATVPVDGGLLNSFIGPGR